MAGVLRHMRRKRPAECLVHRTRQPAAQHRDQLSRVPLRILLDESAQAQRTELAELHTPRARELVDGRELDGAMVTGVIEECLGLWSERELRESRIEHGGLGDGERAQLRGDGFERTPALFARGDAVDPPAHLRVDAVERVEHGISFARHYGPGLQAACRKADRAIARIASSEGVSARATRANLPR